MPRHRHASFLSVLAVSLAAACSPSDDVIEHGEIDVALLNQACSSDAQCEDGLSCETPAVVDEGQCLVYGCPSQGAGPEHGCPEGAACIVFDDVGGHACSALCSSDAECVARNPSLVCGEPDAVSGLRVCNVDPGDSAMPLNAPCTSDGECEAGGMTCGEEGESFAQCTLECSTGGPADETNGCPIGSFCYVFDGDQGHYCTSVCDVDADCQAVNSALVCRERAATESSGLKICVRP